MADLLRKPQGTQGKVHDITAASAGWGYVGFALYRLQPGKPRLRPRVRMKSSLFWSKAKRRSPPRVRIGA